MATELQQTPFVKQLAANDRKTRDAALDSLKTYLSGRRDLPPLELLKLHKGLFYCMWMSDRPLTQQALANALASLVYVLPSGTIIPFLRAYWQTMQREWTNVDVLRMEKFLLLTRRYLGASFEVLKRNSWEEGLVGEMMALLEEVPCNVADVRIPNGLRYHVIDIYVDELEKVGALGEGTEAPLERLLKPLWSLSTKSPTKPVRTKSKEALKDERLPGQDKVEVSKTDDAGWAGIED